MFKKINFKSLLIIFGGLLVFMILLQIIRRSGGERNFKDKLFEVYTAKVSAIIIKPRSEKTEIRLVRSGNVWTFTTKNKTYKAEKTVIEGMLLELSRMKAERIAATDKSDWAQFDVTDTLSTRVKAEQGGKLVADFLVGKFSYQQSNQSAYTYVRLYNEDEVYAVNGFLAMSFNKSVNDLRNKTLVNVNQKDISRLTFSYPADSSFTLSKSNKFWNINGEKADSTKVASYLSSVANLSGYNFVDDAVLQGPQAFLLKIEGNNFPPLELKAFVSDTTNHYFITSNLIPDARFSAAKDNLIKRFFVGARQFKLSQKK